LNSSKLMNVIHVIDSLDLGGAQTLLKGYFESEESGNCELFALRQTQVQTRIQSSKVVICKSSSRFSFQPVFDLFNKIRKNQGKVILHAHLFRSLVTCTLLKWIFPKKTKLVFHEHSQISLGGRFYAFVLRICNTAIDEILTVSKSTKEDLLQIRVIRPEKVHVCYNFASDKKFNNDGKTAKRNAFRKTKGIENSTLVFGFVGRLNEEKGVRDLINAFSMLDVENDAVLWLAGKGPLEKSLRLLAKSNIHQKEKYEFFGYVEDVTSFYHGIDVLVMPSFNEGHPLTLIEAWMCEVPVIVSDIRSFVIVFDITR